MWNKMKMLKNIAEINMMDDEKRKMHKKIM